MRARPWREKSIYIGKKVAAGAGVSALSLVGGVEMASRTSGSPKKGPESVIYALRRHDERYKAPLLRIFFGFNFQRHWRPDTHRTKYSPVYSFCVRTYIPEKCTNRRLRLVFFFFFGRKFSLLYYYILSLFSPFSFYFALRNVTRVTRTMKIHTVAHYYI